MGLLKYDVGDKVKVKTNLLVVTDQASSEKYKHSKIAINEDMAQYMGKTMTVFAILDDLYLMDEDKCLNGWTEDMLEDADIEKKYKVGDKVIVRSDLKTFGEIGELYGGYSATKTMIEFAGKVVTIAKVCDDHYQIVEGDKDPYRWTDEMFSGKYTGEVSTKSYTETYENIIIAKVGDSFKKDCNNNCSECPIEKYKQDNNLDYDCRIIYTVLKLSELGILSSEQ